MDVKNNLRCLIEMVSDTCYFFDVSEIVQMGFVERVSDFHSGNFQDLIQESVSAGFHIVENLRLEWESGINRFDRQGEALFVARIHGQLVGICGLNIDPYVAGTDTGRIHRLYVSENFRHRGIATALLKSVCAEAKKTFKTLRVNAGSTGAGVFYEYLGFTPLRYAERCTHVLSL